MTGTLRKRMTSSFGFYSRLLQQQGVIVIVVFPVFLWYLSSIV